MSTEDIVGIGWDVRGWLNDKQATAVARLTGDSGRLEWLGVSDHFRFPPASRPGLDALLLPALRTAPPQRILSSRRIAIGIDAPLSLPRELCRLVAGESDPYPVPRRQIESPLAYRECERWVAARFGKVPLSAPFDYLGNNATLAMSVSRQLEHQGFALVPQHAPASARAIIEVYPALTKTGPRKSDPGVACLARHLPRDLEPGTDQYDAAICALLALVHQGAGKDLGLPDLIPVPDDADPSEGWIFALATDPVE